jgi:tetratricopeptide (TPR) repeat protein
LELIIEKAMSLHKEDRYATAEMMADDLRRYLDRRPVRARRVGITTRVWHWGQRHRATAALMSTLLVLLFALAVGGPMVAYRYARLAKSQHETIVDLRHLLSESIANTLIELENVPATADAKRKLVDDTLSQSRRLLERGGESDEVRYDVACVYMKLAFVLGLEFGEKLGLKVAGDAISLLEELLQRSPENPAYRFELGRAYRFIGNNSDDSLRQMYFQRSLKLLEPLAAEYKDNLLYGQELDYLRMFFALTHPNDDEADAMMNAALKSTDERRRAASDNVEYLMDHLSVCYYRGKRMSWSDRRDEGLRELQSCYEACQPVLSEILHSTRMHIGYAELNTTLGHLYLESGEIDRAEQYLVQAIQLQDGLIKGYPHSNWLQWSWLQTYCSMAQLQSRQGRTEEAISTYITLLRQKGDFTHLPAWAQGMAVVAEIRLGDLLWLDGRADEANLHYAAALEAELQDDSALLNQALLLADCPNMELRSPEAAIVIIGSRTPFNARWMLALGVAQYRKGEWTGARQSLESGLELRQSDDPDTLAFLASTCANLGDVASARKYAEQSKSSDASPTINWIRHAPARQAAFEREVEETLRTAGDSETQVSWLLNSST